MEQQNNRLSLMEIWLIDYLNHVYDEETHLHVQRLQKRFGAGFAKKMWCRACEKVQGLHNRFRRDNFSTWLTSHVLVRHILITTSGLELQVHKCHHQSNSTRRYQLSRPLQRLERDSSALNVTWFSIQI